MRFNQIQWSTSMVHNVFRVFEFIVQPEEKIRIQNRTFVWTENGKVHTRREFYTLESLLVHFEGFLYAPFRDFFSFMRYARLNPYLLKRGAIAFDAVTPDTGTGASISFSHTVTGTNPGLVFCAANSSTTITGSNATYNSVALTQKITESNQARNEIWTKTIPSTGTNTMAFTWSSAPSSNRQVQIAISFTGTNQTEIAGATNSANNGASNSPSVVVTTTQNNSWVVDCLFIATEDAIVATVGANQTQRWNYDPVMPSAGSTEVQATAGATTMSWSLDLSRGWNQTGIEIKAPQTNTSASFLLNFI